MTDLDVIRILSREPFPMTPAQIRQESDRVLLAIITARYDEEDGTLILERRSSGGPEDQRERLHCADQELPAPEELDIPHEALEWFARKTGGQLHWIVMFWQVGRNRKWSDEQIMEAFVRVTGYRR